MRRVLFSSQAHLSDFSRLLFLHAHREASDLSNELPEESDQFRCLRAACLPNIKGSVGLILAKTSVMRISIPLDLSSRSFIPLPCCIRSRRSTPLSKKEKKHGSWANLKGGGQLAAKAGNGAQMRGMVPGLGSVSGCPTAPRQRRRGAYGHKCMQVS